MRALAVASGVHLPVNLIAAAKFNCRLVLKYTGSFVGTELIEREFGGFMPPPAFRE